MFTTKWFFDRGNIPTWLSSQSALIRDWLGFHQVGKADVRAFRGWGWGGDLSQLRHLEVSSVMRGSPKSSISGCWFQTCFIFHFIYGIILPIDELIFFKMGWNHQPEKTTHTDFPWNKPSSYWRYPKMTMETHHVPGSAGGGAPRHQSSHGGRLPGVSNLLGLIMVVKQCHKPSPISPYHK